MIRKISFIIIFLYSISLYADSTSIKVAAYQLKNVEKGWNQLELDDELLSQMSSINTFIKVNLVSKSNDTIEVPYVIFNTNKVDSVARIPVEIIKKATKGDRKYYTLVADSTQILSNLEFSFNWRSQLGRITLEGSNNRKEWFTISDSLLLGDKRNNFQKISSKIIYKLDSIYKFYRLSTDDSKSELKNVIYENIYSANPTYKKINLKSLKHRTDKEKKKTIYKFSLSKRLPIHYITIDIYSKSEYKRTANLFGLVDSTKTSKGIKYNYKLIETFVLNSADSTNYAFSYPEHYQDYKLEIENGNEKPLKIGRLTVYRQEYLLKARFDKKGESFIQIANTGIFPLYDIDKLKPRIPREMNEMKVGKKIEVDITKEEVVPANTNQIWLMVIMMSVVFIVAFLSIKLSKRKK